MSPAAAARQCLRLFQCTSRSRCCKRFPTLTSAMTYPRRRYCAYHAVVIADLERPPCARTGPSVIGAFGRTDILVSSATDRPLPQISESSVRSAHRITNEGGDRRTGRKQKATSAALTLSGMGDPTRPARLVTDLPRIGPNRSLSRLPKRDRSGLFHLG